MSRTPIIIAHRGLHESFPENSLGAFRAAADAGIEWVEFDVQASRDVQPVIIHDETLDRTTNSYGAVSAHWATTLRNLRLQSGEWHVPVLSDQLPLSDLRVAALVEIKPPNAPLLVHRTARAMRACKLQWMIQSFDRRNLDYAARYAHDVPQAFLVEHEDNLKDALDEDWPALHVAYQLLNASLVKQLRDVGRSVGVWTPNTQSQLLRAIELGVDRIITDEPMMAISLLKEHCVESD